jgi:peroxiredoxin/cold shock CspA family protein
MTVNLKINDRFPDAELTDHRYRKRQLSDFTRPAEIDNELGFTDGYPLILVFYRGFFCPRDQQQMRLLVTYQDELAVNFCRLVAVAIQPPIVQAAFAAGLGAKWTFLCDTERTLIKQINILDETEGEYADTAQPDTFVLRPDLSIYKLYNGWYFVGRPTIEELRQDTRAIMQTHSYYPYEAWNTAEAKQIRIPQSDWARPNVATPPAETTTGVVTQFDFGTGNGNLQLDATGENVFFNFTAIPGEGYRTITPQTPVQCEVIRSASRITVRNIRPLSVDS